MGRGIGIEEEVVIERDHRMKTDKQKKSNTLETIVCRILIYKNKVKIIRNAKKRRGKTFLSMRIFVKPH